MFWGANGQDILVDPAARVVIVHSGNSQKAGLGGNRHLFALRNAIVRIRERNIKRTSPRNTNVAQALDLSMPCISRLAEAEPPVSTVSDVHVPVRLH